jgi:hypothetical protein
MDLLPDGHPAKEKAWDPIKELNFNDHDPRVNFKNPYEEMVDKEMI